MDSMVRTHLIPGQTAAANAEALREELEAGRRLGGVVVMVAEFPQDLARRLRAAKGQPAAVLARRGRSRPLVVGAHGLLARPSARGAQQGTHAVIQTVGSVLQKVIKQITINIDI